MKLVMINDCASVGETLLKYLPPEIDRLHIKRTRGFWSKTVGVAYDILRAEGDLYHANYLLQDCYIAARFGKQPLVGYSVGSDLRVYLKHWPWSRLIKHNLKNCDKIIVSTPDLLDIGMRFRKDVEYLPPPVDTELFFPKPSLQPGERTRILIASNASWLGKGTDMAIRALSHLRDGVQVSIIEHGVDFGKTLELASLLNLDLNILPKVPHYRMNEYYWNSDMVFDQFLVGCPGMTALEAIACGRPVVTYVSSVYPEHATFPLKDVNTPKAIIEAVNEIDASDDVLKKQRQYVAVTHQKDTVLKKLLNIYNSLTKR